MKIFLCGNYVVYPEENFFRVRDYKNNIPVSTHFDYGYAVLACRRLHETDAIVNRFYSRPSAEISKDLRATHDEYKALGFSTE